MIIKKHNYLVLNCFTHNSKYWLLKRNSLKSFINKIENKEYNQLQRCTLEIFMKSNVQLCHFKKKKVNCEKKIVRKKCKDGIKITIIFKNSASLVIAK